MRSLFCGNSFLFGKILRVPSRDHSGGLNCNDSTSVHKKIWLKILTCAGLMAEESSYASAGGLPGNATVGRRIRDAMAPPSTVGRCTKPLHGRHAGARQVEVQRGRITASTRKILLARIPLRGTGPTASTLTANSTSSFHYANISLDPLSSLRSSILLKLMLIAD